MYYCVVWLCAYHHKFGVCNCCRKRCARRQWQPKTDEVKDDKGQSNVQVPTRQEMKIFADDDNNDDTCTNLDEREPLISIVSYQ